MCVYALMHIQFVTNQGATVWTNAHLSFFKTFSPLPMCVLKYLVFSKEKIVSESHIGK